MSRRFTARLRAFPTAFMLCAVLFAAPQTAPPPAIQIRILEGDGAINSIRLHRAHDPVVRVLDASDRPVSGATVTFLLPALGAGGMFQDNGLSLTVETDARGMATAHGLRPNRIAGPFRIRVTASWQGHPATAGLTETNAEPVAKSGSSKKVVILALIGGAAAAGIAVAAHGGNKSSNSNTGAAATGAGGSTGATIVSGAPSLGPPH
ncbi:MAG TPA: carboxypeptidase-like regulatory domain-containing protein [Bryobacteraceae bacterium]|nr:carboxypeptidase-like regulatory domain-containing protein [Bryobacteraceae bacterium]